MVDPHAAEDHNLHRSTWFSAVVRPRRSSPCPRKTEHIVSVSSEHTFTVAQLWRYPVKSMRGEALDGAELFAGGVVGDRSRAVVDAESGKVVSASYAARRWADLVTWTATFLEEPAAGSVPPPVRLTPPSGSSLDSDDPEVDAVLSRRLDREARLATASEAGDASSRGGLASGGLWDVHPVHLLTTGRLARLAREGPDSIFDPQRFRPNLVIDSGEDAGFLEDGWLGHTLHVGGARLRIVAGAPRCVLTTHAQGRLPRDPGILRTAAHVNAGSVGVYAEVEIPGPVHVADTVRIDR